MKRAVKLLGFSLILAAVAHAERKDDACSVYSGTLRESTGIGMMLQMKSKANSPTS